MHLYHQSELELLNASLLFLRLHKNFLVNFQCACCTSKYCANALVLLTWSFWWTGVRPVFLYVHLLVFLLGSFIVPFLMLPDYFSSSRLSSASTIGQNTWYNFHFKKCWFLDFHLHHPGSSFLLLQPLQPCFALLHLCSLYNWKLLFHLLWSNNWTPIAGVPI